MTPLEALIAALRSLPANWRKGLYVGLGVVAALVGVLDILDLTVIPEVVLSKAQEVIAYLAVLFAVPAANVTPDAPAEDEVPGDES